MVTILMLHLKHMKVVKPHVIAWSVRKAF